MCVKTSTPSGSKQKLALYTATAAATLATTSDGGAAVLIKDLSSSPLVINSSTYLRFNFTTTGSFDFSFATSSIPGSAQIGFVFSGGALSIRARYGYATGGGGFNFGGGASTTSFVNAKKFDVGDSITDAAFATYSSNFGLRIANTSGEGDFYTSSGTVGGFIGIGLAESSSAFTPRFGWFDVEVSAGGGSITIKRMAFEELLGDPAEITAIPEPTSLGLLAAGASGLLAYRRLRRKKMEA